MSHPTEFDQQALQLYTTADYPCSYLPKQVARSQVATPAHLITPAVYSRLIEQGFRRSGLFTYRPHCRACQACIPLRVDVRNFKPSRTQKRVTRRHGHLATRTMALELHPDHYQLYCRYQQARHKGAGMDENTQGQYQDFLLASAIDTRLLEFREADGTLSIVSVIDIIDNGWSAVYTFYDPDAAGSLGTYAVLWQIQQCRQLGLPWLYLGYWIAGSPKMSYKQQFRPYQILADSRWCDPDQSDQR